MSDASSGKEHLMALARNAKCEADPRKCSRKSEIDPLDEPVGGGQDGIAKILNTSPKRCEHLLRGAVIGRLRREAQ
jgi:hypothetical protein